MDPKNFTKPKQTTTYLLKELDIVACWPNHCQQDGIGHMLFLGD